MRIRAIAAACLPALTALALAGCAISGTAAGSTAPGSHGHRGGASASTGSQRGGSPAATPAPSPSPSPASKPLAGKIVGIDPGHNGRNYTDPSYIDHLIWNGREWEACNTTGTETDGGYTEARFNFNVAMYLAADLKALGARVVLTRHNNHGIGPCVNKRAEIIDHSGADVAIDIHADGGPPGGRGFTVLEPVADGPNNKVIRPSFRFGGYVHNALIANSPMRPSDYYGHNGYMPRNNLAGLNLTTVPEVLIECGNMRNSADAALLITAAVQKKIARSLEAAIVRFLTGKWPSGTAG
jgi:N-acetylmuramoyl-L-alanine amidase